jgi:hypothetical protein
MISLSGIVSSQLGSLFLKKRSSLLVDLPSISLLKTANSIFPRGIDRDQYLVMIQDNQYVLKRLW